MSPSKFAHLRTRTLHALSLDSSNYTDLSPKGSVDEGVRDLINIINSNQHLVTSSSCSGRVSIYIEGKKRSSNEAENEHAIENEQANEQANEYLTKPELESEPQARASVGGKGGGSWMFVQHEPIPLDDAEWSCDRLLDKFALQQCNTDHDTRTSSIPEDASLIHVKFEAMILHLYAETIQHAVPILRAAFASGFRESGAMTLPTTNNDPVMIAIRSNGLAFDSIIGYQDDNGSRWSIVDSNYIFNMLKIANQRFVVNLERISRFQHLVVASMHMKPSEREDKEARRLRKKAEGLARQQQLLEDKKINF